MIAIIVVAVHALGLVPVGRAQEPSVSRAHSHELPGLDVEAILVVEHPQHLPLGQVLLPQLLNPVDELLVPIRGALLGGEVPATELRLESAFAVRCV